MGVAERIRYKLTEALAPSRLELSDDSHRHAGHAGARPEGEVLAEELAGPVHALSLKMLTPSEANGAG